jgi:hypothetical protein
MRQGIAPVKRDVENPEMPRHSYISYEINEADTHCAPLYMPDNLESRPEIKAPNYRLGKAPSKP